MGFRDPPLGRVFLWVRNRVRWRRWALIAMLIVTKLAYSSDYGTTGLIDIPSARMRDDGEIAFTAAHDGYAESYSLTYQLLPRVEGTFRYTGLKDFFYWDRNYEIKLGLLDESRVLPAVAVGIRDTVGTGVYGGEYLVGSKRWGSFDFSLGLGWGRLADRAAISNPLIQAHPYFATRTNDVGLGGEFSLNSWFSGPNTGVFGGVEYRPERFPVRFVAEYNPDQYRWEAARGATSPSSPFSLGAIWESQAGHSVGLSHQHGDAWGLNVSLVFDTTRSPPKVRPSPILPLRNPARSAPDWYWETSESLLQLGIVPLSIDVSKTDKTAQIELSRGAYTYWPDAVTAAHAQAIATLPPEVTRVDYLVNEAGLNLQTLRLPTRQAKPTLGSMPLNERALTLPSQPAEADAMRLSDHFTSTPTVTAFVDVNYHLFDPDNPLGYQVYAGLGSAIPLGNDVFALGVYQHNLVTNLDKNTRESDSVLPRVRSNVAKYLKQSPSKLSVLRVERRGTLNQGLHYRLFGGVLESMYSGVGAEVLYQPYHSRFAYGLSGAYARQRDFEGGLGHLDYSVFTGHASVFWATPFYNYDAALHVGRYLAKDVGGTFEMRRTFDNGWSVGLWSTLTDVPFETFGEGSFDKGIYLQIPLRLNITGGVGSTFASRVRPILRDGGARLEDYSGQLWWDSRMGRSDVFLDAPR